jgi:predicted permease
MEAWRHDLRHGLRVLVQARGFTAVAALSLAIGIGANSALFSVANALLLKPLGYASADRIAIIWQRSPGLNVAQDWLSVGQYLDVKTDSRVFDQVAATIGASVNLTGDGPPERVDGARVSSSLFPLFRASAALGRVFSKAEDEPGQAPVVILSDGFWRRRFGSDPSVIGRSLMLNGHPFTVIGVMPATFRFNKEVMPAVNGIQNVDFLLPLPLTGSARATRDREDFNVFARLKPGVSMAQAQTEMNLVADRMKREYPANYPPGGGLTISVVPLLTQVVGDVRRPLYILLGAVGFVLLIACGNVTNLLLSRAAIRQKEMAIRAAVGASQQRLVRQLMAESLLLSLLGGALGLMLAELAVQALRRAGPANIPRLAEVAVDLRVVGFTFVASLVTGVLFGLAPAVRAARVDPNDVLKEGGRGSAGTRAFGLGHNRLRGLLIAVEVGLSVVLLVGAGLLIRSYQRILNASPGFDPHNLLTLRLSLPGFRYPTPEAVAGFFRTLDERIRAVPGVEYVGANYLLPLSSVALGWEPISIEGYVPKAPGEDLIIASSGYISPDYFRAMGIPLVKGRFFTRQDTRGAPPVVIVDDRLAARFWPAGDPLGMRLRRGNDGPWYTVVGIVADGKEYDADREPPIRAYFSLDQLVVGTRYLAVRSAIEPASLTAAITREIRSLDPDLPVFDVGTMDERLRESLAHRRFVMVLLGAFATVALLLAATGIYGVTSYWANQRTREIGVRMAMGAMPDAIQRMVVRQAMVPVAIGASSGLLAAWGLTRILASLLFGVSTTDRVTFGLVPILLGSIAVLASYVPARRASRVDPLVAVRQE